MRQQPYFLILIVCTFFLYGCPSVIEVPLPPHEHKLVINSLLHPGTSIKIYVSHSVGILEDKGEKGTLVKNAKVTIFEDDISLGQLTYRDTIRWIHNSSRSVPWGFYHLPYAPKAGHTYRVEVVHDHYPTASATTKIPTFPHITHHRFAPYHLLNESGDPLHLLTLRVESDSFDRQKTFYQVTGDFAYTTDTGMPDDGKFYFSSLRQNDVFPRQEGVFFQTQDESLPRLYFLGIGNESQVPVNPPFEKAAFELRTCDSLYFAYILYFPNQQEAAFGDFQFFPQEIEELPTNVQGGYGLVTSYAGIRDSL